MPSISIITAIHNGIHFNRIFFESLQQYTTNSFELIVIDNNSTDGSREFFESKGARVLRNADNFSYGYCQNQGIELAGTNWLFFLNNDLMLSPQWDERLLAVAQKHDVQVLSAAGLENLGTYKITNAMQRRWKRTKNPLSLFGFGETNLKRMHWLMYGNWKNFCQKRWDRYGTTIVEGIVGNNVLIRKDVLDKIGPWDERIQAADFDLFMRTKKRSQQYQDVQPPQVALGVFIHHYGRMTAKYAVKPKPFANADKLIRLEDKWTADELDLLHPDNATIRKK